MVDNATSEDVTAQTLTQIVLEEGKAGRSKLPAELLHDLVRVGERALSSGVEQVQQGVDRLLQASIDRLGPIRRVRDEMTVLRSRLEELEISLSRLESGGPAVAGAPAGRKAAAKGAAKRASKPRARKPAKKAAAKAKRTGGARKKKKSARGPASRKGAS